LGPSSHRAPFSFSLSERGRQLCPPVVRGADNRSGTGYVLITKGGPVRGVATDLKAGRLTEGRRSWAEPGGSKSRRSRGRYLGVDGRRWRGWGREVSTAGLALRRCATRTSRSGANPAAGVLHGYFAFPIVSWSSSKPAGRQRQGFTCPGGHTRQRRGRDVYTWPAIVGPSRHPTASFTPFARLEKRGVRPAMQAGGHQTASGAAMRPLA